MPLYSLFRPLLFRLEPETAHEVGMRALRTVEKFPALERALVSRYGSPEPALAQRLLGKVFTNPVGLAAGFDKNASALGALHALGFGFVEVGTVTPRAQAGNPKPRLFRYAEAEALQNALGFNNAGRQAVRAMLEAARPYAVPVGVNLGKSRTTPEDGALEDYALLLSELAGLADYLVINLSSPNTPGLRDLQNEAFLHDLFLRKEEITDKPVLVKIAPDLDPEDAAHLAEAAIDYGAAGIVATNTTTDYSLLAGAKATGGLSGRVLREKSFAVFEAVAKTVFGRAVLVSVGGIDSGREAYRRIRAGASLVQLYTALVYRGPSLIRRINEEILELLARDGFGTVGEAVGADRKRG